MPSSDSSDSADERMPKRTKSQQPSVHVITSKKQEKRIHCSRLIRNKWFIVGVAALIFLIILAIILGVTLGSKKDEDFSNMERIPIKWWQNATIYRAYVTSFLDSDGDGIGDFIGLQNRLSYLVDLGVDVLWLSPIQETSSISLEDVVEFKMAKDEYGLLQDLTALISMARSLGLKVVMDIILNQSGSAHTWFKQSQAKTDPYRDYYIWHQGKVTSSEKRPDPPNNWLSVFGDSAWLWSAPRNEYVLHQFYVNEPDLNFRNSRVISEMNQVVSFWNSQGVDGFFVRDVPWWFEDQQWRDENQISSMGNQWNNMGNQMTYSTGYDSLSHNYTRDLPESYQTVSSLFSIGQDKILMVKSNDQVLNDDRASQLYQLVTTKVLYNLKPTFSGNDVKDVVQQTLESFNKSRVWPVWALGDEDHSRIMTKFDTKSAGLQMIQILLPGTASIYYGEEIQMKDHPSISYEDTVEPFVKAAGPQNYSRYSQLSRDPYHTPMLWNSSRNAGFTIAQQPWLPIYSSGQTVDSMQSKPNSLWHTVGFMNRLKKSSIALSNGTIDFPYVDNEIFSFTRVHPYDRTGYLIVWNVGNQGKRISFDNTNVTYIPNDLTVVYKVKYDGSRNETMTVKRNDVNVDSRELILFSFWK